jgi:hypothetical protein
MHSICVMKKDSIYFDGQYLFRQDLRRHARLIMNLKEEYLNLSAVKAGERIRLGWIGFQNRKDCFSLRITSTIAGMHSTAKQYSLRIRGPLRQLHRNEYMLYKQLQNSFSDA